MKRSRLVLSLLPSLLLVSSTLAQTADPQTAIDPRDDDAITAARIPYLQTSATPNEALDQSANAPAADDSKDDNTLAQMRRRPGRPFPRRTRYPRASYPSPWVEPGNGRHAAIGAVIGFGLGAAVGAKANTDQHPGVGLKASLLVGALGAAIGAAVGYGVPTMHRWAGNRHRPRSPEEDTLASASSEVKAREPSDSLQQASPGRPVGTEVNAQVSQATP